MTVLGVHCLLGSFLMPGRDMKRLQDYGVCINSDTHKISCEILLKTTIFDSKHILTVVVGDDVQTVEQLSLVFMDSLDLNVEHGVWVDLYLVVLLQVHSKLHLIFLHYQNIVTLLHNRQGLLLQLLVI